MKILLLSLEKIIDVKIRALKKLKDFLDKKLDNGNDKSIKIVQTISYWIMDYVKMLEYEDVAAERQFKRYKRGDVIKVNFGHRIGREHGGLHYAIVLDVANNIKSNTVTVIPLSSVKPNVDLNKLGKDRIYIGDEIYKAIVNKYNQTYNTEQNKEELNKELSRLKIGSIALIGQIITISKYRIYDPLSTQNVLHGIRVSNTTLNALDQKVKELFTNSD